MRLPLGHFLIPPGAAQLAHDPVEGRGDALRAAYAAGLPQCTAHGRRKAIMRRLAELGTSQQGIKSVSQHSGDAEVAIYTREADQQRMAAAAIGELARWEMSNLGSGLDTDGAETG